MKQGRKLFAAAAAVTIAGLLLSFFPVQTEGDSMLPCISDGEILLCRKKFKLRRGDVIVFGCNGSLMIKRIVGMPRETIDIDSGGKVTVNGRALDESGCIKDLSLGECDIKLPCTMGKDEYFVMGDNREKSLDSRFSAVGTVKKRTVEGKAFLRIRPSVKLL